MMKINKYLVTPGALNSEEHSVWFMPTTKRTTVLITKGKTRLARAIMDENFQSYSYVDGQGDMWSITTNLKNVSIQSVVEEALDKNKDNEAIFLCIKDEFDWEKQEAILILKCSHDYSKMYAQNLLRTNMAWLLRQKG